jgi:uncharacterized protein YyaL (SSP411 family)
MNLDYVNNRFASPTGAYNLASTPPPSNSNLPPNGAEEPQIVRIMNLKPGSDNALPSPNGIIASNLLLLSSYLAEPSYKTLAKRTIEAFAIEIIQHPFLFVSMLSAIVLEAVGVRSIVAVGDAALNRLRGFGRTVVRLHGQHGKGWLTERNQLLRGLKLRDGEKSRIMICEAGTCRDMKSDELDARGEQQPRRAEGGSCSTPEEDPAHL